MRLHEVMFEWDGWSLSAPRPGAVLLDGADAAANSRVGSTEIDPATGTSYKIGEWVDPALPFKAEHRITAGSLPPLRHGASYRFRLRAVDLSGYAIPFDATDTDFEAPTVSDEIVFQRTDPLLPPVIVPSGAYKTVTGLDPDGVSAVMPIETSHRLVIRGDYSSPVPQAETAERHIAPPRTSVQAAERHGALDVQAGTTMAMDRQSWGLLKLRDEWQLPRDVNGAAAAVASLTPLQYLPDPLAGGVALRGLPGVADAAGVTVLGEGVTAVTVEVPSGSGRSKPVTVCRVPFEEFGRPWYDKLPFKLRIKGGEAVDERASVHRAPAPPTWDPAARVLTVEVPRGERVSVDLSTYPNRANAFNPLLWAKRLAKSQPALSALLSRLVVMGTYWMTSPAETIELIHAIARPLLSPEWAYVPMAERSAGETKIKLQGALRVHGPSTGRAEVFADWTENVDLPENAGPIPRKGAARVQSFTVEDSMTVIGGGAFIMHDIGDTRAHTVSYRAVATSRYTDYFAPGTTMTRGMVRPAQIVAPSTVRPLAPLLDYVVPIFDWSEDRSPASDGSPKVVSKRATGLRVYLQRPWYSSGDGEMLGLVASQAAFWGSADTWATTFGGDRTLATPASPLQNAVLTDFLSTQCTATGLSLPASQSGAVVDIAGYPVTYDADKGLWRADVFLALQSYYSPMVQLAMARYQPDSLAGCELSESVTADYVPLPAERTCTLQKSPTAGSLKVAVTGPYFTSTAVNRYYGTLGRERFVGRIEAHTVGGPDMSSIGVQLPGVPAGAWTKVSEFTLPEQLSGSTVTGWQATFALPAAQAGTEYRLVISEFQDFATEVVKTDTVPTGSNLLGPSVEKLVYADSISLTPWMG
jgi:hypothetical protein